MLLRYDGPPLLLTRKMTLLLMRRWLPDFVRDDVLRARVVIDVTYDTLIDDGIDDTTTTNNIKVKRQSMRLDDTNHGVFIWWYDNGQKAEQGTYVDGKMHGEFTTWYGNKKLASRIMYRHGKRDVQSAAYWTMNGGRWWPTSKLLF